MRRHLDPHEQIPCGAAPGARRSLPRQADHAAGIDPGRNLHREPLGLATAIERQIRRVGLSGKEKKVQIRAHPAVALHLLEEERATFDRLRKEHGVEVEVRDDPLLHRDEFNLVSLPSQRPLKLDLSA